MIEKNEPERIQEETVGANLNYYPEICLGRMRKSEEPKSG
jgi:hypothetical protein